MADFDKYEDMNDVKLKPRMLETLITDHLPNAIDPLPDFVDVAKIVRNLKNFGLLSESCPQEADSRLVKEWADAVDDWVQRLLSLVSSPRVSWLLF